MIAPPRARRVLRGGEVALAFAAGVASFALVSVALAVFESGLFAAVFGAACVAAVIAVARRWGVAYAVPSAMAALLGYDWYQFPPTHAEEFPSSGNLANLVVYLAVSVLVGELAASAARRAARLAEEQAALRHVATLVARGVPASEVFAAVAQELGELLDVDATHLGRLEPDGTSVTVGAWGRAGDHIPVGMRLSVDGQSVSSLIAKSGRSARVDNYDDAVGPIADQIRALGIRSSVGCPITVDGRPWGLLVASSKAEVPLPPDTESRISGFTELVATALSNAEARLEVSRLADEQAALRRVATLVARGVPPSDVFAAVTREVGGLLDVDASYLGRFERDGTMTAVGAWESGGAEGPVGTRIVLDGSGVSSLVARTGRPARLDSLDDVSGPQVELIRNLGFRSSAGAPIVIDERPWGVMIVSSKADEPMPADTESRIEAFTELVATALSNAEAREEVRRLADEQAALRHVATVVARESPPQEVFAAVAGEMARLLDVDAVKMARYDADGMATIVGNWGDADYLPVGARVPLGGHNILSDVQRTGRPARVDDYATATGAIGAAVRDGGVRSALGGPIVVDGRLWGAVVVSARHAEPLPPGTESRIGEFTELVATAISNIEARAELAESRARIVAAADDERRRVVRDLHDGAQQRLVHTVITLKLARQALERGDDAAREHVTVALDNARGDDRGAARARPRNPAFRPDARRAARGSGGARRSDAGPGRERRRRGAAPGDRGGDRLFRRGGGAHQRRQARSSRPRRRRGARRGGHARPPRPRRRRRRCPARRKRHRRAPRPARRARRPPACREPG